MNHDPHIAWPLIALVALWMTWEAIKWIDRRNTAYVEQMVADALADGEAMWELWLCDVPDLDPTPIYSATAEHIAKHEVVNLDAEWAELNGDAS